MFVATRVYIATSTTTGFLTSEPIAHAHMQSSQHDRSVVEQPWPVWVEWCDGIAMPQPCCIDGVACDAIIAGRAETIAMASIATRAQRSEYTIDRITRG